MSLPAGFTGDVTVSHQGGKIRTDPPEVVVATTGDSS